jgi:cytochrome c-type biogenesis protein CcmE
MTDQPAPANAVPARHPNPRFYVGLVGVTLVITYLIWTGVSETMVYYLTPTEFMERIDQDPTFREVGVKVSGRLVLNSYERLGMNQHRFRITDLEDPTTVMIVEYNDALPDTFNDKQPETEVVAEGRLRPDGTFQAHLVLTKCGSRYEAAPEHDGEGTYADMEQATG